MGMHESVYPYFIFLSPYAAVKMCIVYYYHIDWSIVCLSSIPFAHYVLLNHSL